MKNLIAKYLGITSVYVVIANEEEKVKECLVFFSNEKAYTARDALIKNYGGANVCIASRRII